MKTQQPTNNIGTPLPPKQNLYIIVRTKIRSKQDKIDGVKLLRWYWSDTSGWNRCAYLSDEFQRKNLAKDTMRACMLKEGHGNGNNSTYAYNTIKKNNLVPFRMETVMAPIITNLDEL